MKPPTPFMKFPALWLPFLARGRRFVGSPFKVDRSPPTLERARLSYFHIARIFVRVCLCDLPQNVRQWVQIIGVRRNYPPHSALGSFDKPQLLKPVNRTLNLTTGNTNAPRKRAHAGKRQIVLFPPASNELDHHKNLYWRETATLVKELIYKEKIVWDLRESALCDILTPLIHDIRHFRFDLSNGHF